MSKIATFEKLRKEAQRDTNAIRTYIGNKDNKEGAFVEALDALATNANWMKEFKTELASRLPASKDKIDGMREFSKEELTAQLDTLDATQAERDAEMKRFEKKSYTIEGISTTSPNIGNLLNTTVLPIIDGLIRDDEGLISMVDVRPVDSIDRAMRINEFDAETLAENLAETGAGTAVDDGNRFVDELTPKKIQASTSMSELALMSLSPANYASFIAKLIRRVQNQLALQILYGDNTGNNLRGIVPTTGSGQTRMGALDVISPSGTPDNLDLILEMLKEFPDVMSNEEENNMTILMTRTTKFNLMSLNTTNSYKAFGDGYGPMTANQLFGYNYKTINAGLKRSSTTADVLIGNFKNYKLQLKRGILLKNDEGKTQIKEGIYNFVANMYCDGTPTLAFLYSNDSAGASASGSNAPNNSDRNAWRRKLLTVN